MLTLFLSCSQFMFSKPLIYFGSLHHKPSLVALHLYCIWIKSKASNFGVSLALLSPSWTQGLQRRKKCLLNLLFCTFSVVGTCFIANDRRDLCSSCLLLEDFSENQENKANNQNEIKNKTSPNAVLELFSILC